MIELGMIRDLVAIFGVIAGLTYYILTIMNANRTRKTQTLMQLRERVITKEYLRDYMELLETHWSDYNDFMNKYDSSVNIENYAKRFKIWTFLDGIGYQLHKGLIDRDSVYYLLQGIGANLQWRKWKPIIEEQRKRYDNPEWWKWFEYLADEITKIRVERGLQPETTDADGYFTP